MSVRAFILGGARSGKSAAAERMIHDLRAERVLYVATAETPDDPDLELRVRAHRERRPARWSTLELGGGDLDAVLDTAEDHDAVLFDSLTLWVSARMRRTDALEQFDVFLEGAEALDAAVFLVSDEVGLGVVPENAAAREFRDLLGLVNQRAAAAAGEVHLWVAGIGMRIK